MMKRYLRTLALGFLLLFPSVGLAATPHAGAVPIFGKICTGKNSTQTDAGSTDVCQETKKGGNPVVKAIRVAIDILAIVIGASAVIVIILSGFKMIRSNGNSQEIATARTGILYAAIGLAIAAVAPVIVGYVLNSL